MILSKDGANADFANASRAILVSDADKPACANVELTANKSDDATPKLVANLVISSVTPFKSFTDCPVTCDNLTTSLLKTKNSLYPAVMAFVKP